jgi:TonB-linked SusC/RagA family outer membrane protein
VVIEGTRIGAATDRDGNYRLDRIPPGTYTVIARFIGYESIRKSVRILGGEELTLDFQLLSTVVGLDEVVVTGTAVATEKRQLGNSISTVSAQELEMSGSPAIDRALSGKFAGVLVQQNSGNPAGGVSVRLRGVATILGSADPLYMIDGVIVNNDSPELLNLGGSAQNRLVDIDPNDVDRIEIVKGAAAAALYGSRANNGIVQIFTKRGRYGTPQISYSTSLQTSHIRKTLEVNEYPFDKRVGDATAKPVTRYDWQDYMFRSALGSEQSLSISGGAGGTRYIASGSYTANDGIMKGVSYQRANAHLGIDHTINEWMSLTLDARYIRSGSHEIPNGGLPANWGAIPGFLFGPNTFDPRPDPVTGVYPHLGAFENPVEVVDLYDYQQKVNRFVSGTKLVLNPMEGLTAEYVLGYDTYNQSATAFIPVGTSAPGYANGLARRAERDFYAVNNDMNISYRTFLMPEVQSTTSVGGTVQYENASTFSAQSSDLSPVAQIVPGGATQSIGEFRSEQSVYGFFAQETIGLWGRLFVTAAGRVDASSVFGKDNRWQFYPKVSASYVISDESFWKNSGFSNYVPSLKLRAAGGESGGLTAIGPYDRFTTFPSVTYDNKPGVIPSSQLGATNVKPERQRGMEFGFDAGFLSNRLALELSYYTQHTKDLLLTRSLAYTTGYSTQLENVGTLDNKGYEFLIRGVPFDGDIRWSATLVYAANKNEVNDIEGGVRTLPDSYSITAAVNGQPLGVFYGSNFQRDAGGNIVYDAAGLPVRSTTNKVIGDPNPKYTTSLTNEVQIGKQWSFRIQFDAVVGNKTFNFARRIGIYPVYGTLKDYELELKGQYPAGYNNRVFGIYENWIEDGSFVKLREVSVSYILYPTEWGLRSLMISLVGRNLLSIDNYSGYDPEVNIGGQRTGTRGFDFGEVPIPRSFSIKLTANL